MSKMELEHTYNENFDNISRIARESFQNHLLTQELDHNKYKIFRCGRPNESAYFFNLISAPGYIHVYGDIADNSLRMSARNPIVWLQGAIDSRDYIMSKIVNPHKQFYVADFIDMMDRDIQYAQEHADYLMSGVDEDEKMDPAVYESCKEDAGLFKVQAVKRTVLEQFDPGYHSPDELLRIYYENTDGDMEGAYHCWQYDYDAMWTYEALKCFVRLYTTRKSKTFSGSTIIKTL